ncbi:MAG: UDP-N-acetylglucosamine 2-epimerase, partial [Planctomycetes bacterium]|nr:UDP-N-acetylglucosamine 2-epimerase [Planctomycetota bacterium]
IDGLRRQRLRPHDEVARALGLDPPEPFALLIHHPDTLGWERAGEETERIIEAVAEAGLAVAAVYPNGDPGSPAIIEVLRRTEGPRFRIFRNLPRGLFVEAMARAALVIGNSSAAIIEGPTLGVPAVNVGERNREREHGANVIFAPSDPEALRAAVGRALDPAFRARAEAAPSPYGDGGTGPRAARILAEIPIDRRLIAKRWSL